MKRKITYIIVMIIALMIILQIESFAKTAVITADSLNLRSKASTDSNVIETLKQKDEIEVVSEEGEWYQVKHNENEGYVKKEYVEIKEDTNSSINKETDNFQSIIIEENEVKVTENTKIRIIPTINSNIIGEVEAGSQLEIITKLDHWIFVQNDKLSGWIYFDSNKKSSEDIKESDEKKENEPVEEKKDLEQPNEEKVEEYKKSTKYVKGSSIYMRKGPSTETEIVVTLIKNTDVTVIGEENGWYKVEYENNTGYIREDLLSDTKIIETSSRDGENIERNITETSTSQGTDIVNYAYNFLGCPYVYGGSGPSSFDCSGFTAYIYKKFGYSLPHSAVTQMNYGVEVSKDELQPGDLVFFLDYQTMDGVGHCGMYIGNGEFIHASSGSGYCVKTSTLLTGSYKNRYYTARRLL